VRPAVAAEVRQLQEEVESLKSRTMEGRTILTGTMPTWKVGDNLTMTTEDLTALLDEAIGYLSDLDEGLRGVGGQDVKVALTNLDMTADKTLAQRATNGARVARIETLETKLVDLDIEYKSLLSDVEDVDITEVIVKLKSAEAAFQAALGAGAKLIQPSLLDYLE
jgi:flagellar hook-associated protein 3 FlgL